MLVFDTEALLSFYLNEKGSEVVEERLNKVSDKQEVGLINVVNLAELWYILARKDRRVADQKIDTLRSFGVRVVPVEADSLWKKAAEIKSMRSITLADAFAAATALVFGETLLVGRDAHFKDLPVDVERVS